MSSQSALVWAVLAISIALIVKVLIQASSPLRKIPSAHWSAPFSSIWIDYHRVRQHATPIVHLAHLRHGPVIRLAPNQISVNCVDGGIRTIYSGGYEKGEWYSNVFNNYGIRPMFCMEHRDAHSKRKRMISNIYAKSTLQNSESMAAISKILLHDRMLPQLQNVQRQGQVVDMYDVFSAITMDFICAYAFGLENGSNLLGDIKYAGDYTRAFKARTRAAVWPQELPVLTRFIESVGLGWLLAPAFGHPGIDEIEPWVLSMCDKAESACQAGLASKRPEDYPCVYSQLRSSMLKENLRHGNDMTKAEIIAKHRIDIASELVDHTFAGFDTSGTTLTWLTWEISKESNLEWQDRLHRECAQSTSTDLKAVDSLPVVHAVLMETLRLHAAIPGNQPRITPANAVIGPPGQEYTGLPANVRVQAQAWSLHRNPDVFPDPESWSPQRWLDADAEQFKEMLRWFWAFGSGGRMCVGSNLAMLEMKAIIVTIWRHFRTSIAFAEGMTPNHGYSYEPLGKNGRILEIRLTAI